MDFCDVSYGFRPNRSCHDALDMVDMIIMTKPVNSVVDMDITKFVDTVDQECMMECLKQRVVDPSLLRIIARFLKSGVMEEGKYQETDRGTPQGGILSPILANIYLHYVLDLWFEKEMKEQLKGFAQLVRYADDFIVCFQHDDEAKAFGQALRERLAKFGISGNIRGLQSFYHHTTKLAFKWINRRSQRKSYSWTQFDRFLSFF